MLNSSFSICIMKHMDMHSYSSHVQNWQRIASWLLCAWIRYIIYFFSVLSFLFTSPSYFREIQLIFVFNLLIHQSFVSLDSVFSLFITQNWYCKFHANTILMNRFTIIFMKLIRVIICPFGHKLCHTIFRLCPTFLWVGSKHCLHYKYAMIILNLLPFSVIFNNISLSFE